jgi:hypothetical protein
MDQNTDQGCSSPKTRANIERQRQMRIAERRAQMPRSYRANYDKAVGGKSLRASINAFCLECVCWQIEEIRNCSDFACPLYAVRPYQLPQNAREGRSAQPQSKKSLQEVPEAAT